MDNSFIHTGTIRAAIKVLRLTPENWIEFSAGQNTTSNLRRFKSRSMLLMLVRQILGYLKLIFVHLKLKRFSHERKDILFFAVTPNQYGVLMPIAEELRGSEYIFLTTKTLGKNAGDSSTLSMSIEINIAHVLLLLLLHLIRLKALIYIFLAKPRLFFLRGKSILSVHFWIIYHINILKAVRPRLVIVANDHNAETRSLVEACKIIENSECVCSACGSK